ncbi:MULTISPECIES: flagellar hook-length control protein FliK [Brenneria]|uniref:Flagellar hook-length control protein FliK n=1 Tax=Brenneria nigrifluens DSM 30175 = ATCC 13028 TaxID=1121120 RepID=A0A2U1UUL8_9GAMM|nr:MULTISPECIES: flagellar hook-length control protein FliK [Brenneria]EHD22022.1 flagellar hook-length control protein [Brenneria sp. EniD312]PWC25353.1 flagellar hook-length control protein FliK [Brenneria nigrifluens DSM 30175 = ATCC 13028]QCR05105.1 flagellar hook-length control protein FliK [Brenneria nigrifluens DSM 30175 = ATCC 13028]
MKLPALPITTSTGDTGSSTASLSTQGELPKNFIELLGKQLSLSSDPSANKSLDATDKEALLNALGKDAATLNGDDLNALLASFSALAGTLAPAGKQTPETTKQLDSAAESDDKTNHSADDAATMQALLAMLSATPAATVDNGTADNIQNASFGISGLLDGKRQADAALADTSATDEDAKTTLAKIFGASDTARNDADSLQSSANPSGAVKRNAATAQSDDSVKSALASPLIAGERSNSQEPALTAGNQSVASPQVALAPNVQSTFSSSSATLVPPAHAQLNTPFGSPQWQDALGQQIVMFSRNGQQSAELRLNPQELGALHISLKIDDNQAQIHLASANSQVRSALEAALPHLRNAMAESGINLGQSSVGSDASSWQAQQQTANNSGEGNSGTSYQQQFGDSPENIAKPLEVPAHLQSMASSANGVDIFA